MKSIKSQVKSQIAVFFLLLISVGSFSQEVEITKEKTVRNEIKLNLMYLLGSTIDIAYEHILNENSSLGISLMHTLNEKNSMWKYGITPYYRMFFGKKEASGFFIEGNMAFYSEEINYGTWIYFGTPPPVEFETGFGAGFAIGGKFVNKNGFLVELYLGAGRNFINTDIIEEYYPRAGISIGKRF
ncbi:DUF3575 domain-containing protein [Urechidicola vernalis]|uniref:DUF3575 domain-containing protein n=1 Tax=Urechidicola vernalis TaxID=3075600 RepID=A0ABU2Y7N2_9FLAO|nr:DUF3575 domain-containing protein [Urechidicola sp. P050]MDT0553240.1 DUF3575 domain-containing protein [Urechidicola sp. P050]